VLEKDCGKSPNALSTAQGETIRPALGATHSEADLPRRSRSALALEACWVQGGRQAGSDPHERVVAKPLTGPPPQRPRAARNDIV
jgi:hypothetical protein